MRLSGRRTPVLPFSSSARPTAPLAYDTLPPDTNTRLPVLTPGAWKPEASVRLSSKRYAATGTGGASDFTRTAKAARA